MATWEPSLLPKYVPLTFLIPVLKMATVTFLWLVHFTLEATTAISLLQRANLVHYLIFISILQGPLEEGRMCACFCLCLIQNVNA